MLVRVILLVLGASLVLAQQFPPVKDWKSVRITLERTSCFGSCPAYTVEIRDGVVQYEGRYSTAVLGRQRGTITREELQELIDEFRRADYTRLNARYGGNRDVPGQGPILVACMDAPVYKVSASIDGAANEFVDTNCTHDGAPSVVSVLADSIDRLAHTAKWVRK